jgi:hypothetical protein
VYTGFRKCGLGKYIAGISQEYSFLLENNEKYMTGIYLGYFWNIP